MFVKLGEPTNQPPNRATKYFNTGTRAFKKRNFLCMTKQEYLQKLTNKRNKRIQEMRAKHDKGESYEAIGKSYDPPISRQRVHQLIADIK